MLFYSLIYSSISLLIVIAVIVIVILKQVELASSAVYFMLGLLVGITGWIIGDMLQIILSKPGNEELVLIFSQFATICNMVAMISTVLFARALSAQETFFSKSVALAFTLFGGAVFITLTGAYTSDPTSQYLKAYTVLPYNSELDFIVTSANMWWTIVQSAMVLYAGGILVWYLIRQRKFVKEKQKKIINFMIVGALIAFVVSAVIYVFYLIDPYTYKIMLHLELISAAIGAGMIGIGMIWGGKQVLYGSSKVFSLHIFETSGLSVYAGLFEGEYDVNEHLISGIATAISNFAGQLIGEDVIPHDIELGDYSLMLEQKGDYIALIICEFPTAQVRQSLQNLMQAFDPNYSVNEISELVDEYLPYGKPEIRDLYIRS
jgi:hypothetical protein